MNIIPIILLSILIILLIAWCIQEHSSSDLNFHLDCFLIINNYIKRSFYKVLQQYSQNESTKTLKSKVENIDQFITPLSQQFTKGMVSFPRKKELLQDLKIEISNHSTSIKDTNLFLFPDTLVNKSNSDYYKILVCRVTKMLNQPCHTKNNQEAKFILEAL